MKVHLNPEPAFHRDGDKPAPQPNWAPAPWLQRQLVSEPPWKVAPCCSIPMPRSSPSIKQHGLAASTHDVGCLLEAGGNE